MTVIFWIIAAVAIGSALLCITRKSPVASALWLVNTLFQLAAIYVLLDAHFIAAVQVLVYAGAIMVLFLFVIMLLNLGRGGPSDIKGPWGKVIAGVGGLVLVGELVVLGRVTPSFPLQQAPGALASTVAVSHLIFGGVLEAYPRLKMVVAHGGGFLPAYSGRMDHAARARSDCRRLIKKPPTSYLKKLYFDTIVFSDHQLEYLVQRWGADHVLLGSDYPYDMATPDPVGHVMGARKLRRDEKIAVLGGNAARLLKITRSRASGKSRRT